MNEAIRAEHITFQYEPQEGKEPVPVFEDLCLTVEAGSFVAVLGHNGSGKSTLAKHFNAILLPQGGSVAVFGMDTADEDLLLDIRRTVGMVFQNPDNQIVANVVEEDVAFAPENLGVPPAEIRERVDNALKTVGMYEFRQHAPHLLSGGQKQRVAIAGVIAMQPRIIVLDEPTSFLDIRHKLELLSILHRMAREQKITVVMSLHEVDLAMKISDRILCVRGEEIFACGTPEEVLSDEVIRELYDLDPACGTFDALTGSVELPAPGGGKILKSGSVEVPPGVGNPAQTEESE